MTHQSQHFQTSSGAKLEAVLIPAGNPLPRAPLVTLSICDTEGLGMRDLGSYDAAKLASRGSLSIGGTLLIPNRVNGTRDLEAAVCTEICSWVKLLLETPVVSPLGPRSRLSSLASRLAA
jgi:hypothetical protein